MVGIWNAVGALAIPASALLWSIARGADMRDFRLLPWTVIMALYCNVPMAIVGAVSGSLAEAYGTGTTRRVAQALAPIRNPLRITAVLLLSSVILAGFVRIGFAFRSMNLLLLYALAAAPAWGIVGGIGPGLAAGSAAAIVGAFTYPVWRSSTFLGGCPGFWAIVAAGVAAGLLGGLTTGYLRARGGGVSRDPKSAIGRTLAVCGVWIVVGTLAYAIAISGSPSHVASEMYWILIPLVCNVYMILIGALIGTLTEGLCENFVPAAPATTMPHRAAQISARTLSSLVVAAIIVWVAATVSPSYSYYYKKLTSHYRTPDPSEVTLQSNESVTLLAFAPDGKLVATGRSIWDLTTGQEQARLMEPIGQIYSVAFSPNGRLLATGSSHGAVHLWDGDTGKHLSTLSGHTQWVQSVAFAPDGRTVVAGDVKGTVTLWDVATRKTHIRLDAHTDVVEAIAYSPDGALLATGGRDRVVKLWDVVTGQAKVTLPGSPGWVTSLFFTPDGQNLVTQSGDTVTIWDLAARRIQATRKQVPHKIRSVALAPDGRTLAIGSVHGTVTLWDTATWKEQGTREAHTSSVSVVAFSQDGERLATGTSKGTVKLWKLAVWPEPSTGERAPILTRDINEVHAVALSPDGQRLAIGTAYGTVRFWDGTRILPSPKVLPIELAHSGDVRAIAFSPDGRRLATGSRQIFTVWDIAAGQPQFTRKPGNSYIYSVAFAPDGKLVATTGWRELTMWDAATGDAQAAIDVGRANIRAVTFAPNGREVATAADDGTVKLWSVEAVVRGQNEPLFTMRGDRGAFHSVAFAPDGRKIAAAGDRTVVIGDLITGEVRSLEGHRNRISSLALAPDGNTLVTGNWDGSLNLWDTAKGKIRLTLRGHGSRVNSVAFFPNGKMLASGSKDGTLKFWDAVRTRTDAVRTVHLNPP